MNQGLIALIAIVGLYIVIKYINQKKEEMQKKKEVNKNKSSQAYQEFSSIFNDTLNYQTKKEILKDELVQIEAQGKKILQRTKILSDEKNNEIKTLEDEIEKTKDRYNEQITQHQAKLDNTKKQFQSKKKQIEMLDDMITLQKSLEE
jgi:chromosome segregation ATPase